MSEGTRRKIRPEAVWAQARKAWEGGETARSVARRYDVGVPALWKRREAEGWRRPDPADGPIEPAEGWDRYAQRRLELFELELEAVRELALDLAAAMRGGPLEDAPLWHLTFLYAYRAEHLGPEVAAADRAAAKGKVWGEAFWDEQGRLKPVSALDGIMMRLNRDVWREQIDLPVGAAPNWP